MLVVLRLRPSVRTGRNSAYSVDLRLEVPLALVMAFRIVYRRRSADAPIIFMRIIFDSFKNPPLCIRAEPAGARGGDERCQMILMHDVKFI